MKHPVLYLTKAALMVSETSELFFICCKSVLTDILVVLKRSNGIMFCRLTEWF